MKSKSKNLFAFQPKLISVGDKGKPMMQKDESKNAEPSQPASPFEKLLALKAYSRANNLYFTYGEKWTGKNHKSPTRFLFMLFMSCWSMFKLSLIQIVALLRRIQKLRQDMLP